MNMQRALPLALLAWRRWRLLLGCAEDAQPWVKPYERERLADPIMQARRPAVGAATASTCSTCAKAARGANGVQGGGCGCN
jgi:hypothetical protein